MTPTDLASQCVEQLNLVGDKAEIMLTMQGRCNKSMTKRLAPGGPVGRINGEAMGEPAGRIVVFFGAMDVLAFLAAKGLVKVQASEKWGTA